jgi:hypothetical protein
MSTLIDWLLKGPPWVQYRTRLDLMEQSDDDSEVLASRQAMLANKQIQMLLSELAEWPGLPLKRHNDASHLLHKLVFISDLGIRASDHGINQIIERILKYQSKDGAFQILTNVSPNFGGTGKDQLAWMLCDAPSVIYALTKLCIEEDSEIELATKHLASLSFDNGWPCAVTSELGKFRGPGRKTDPCPYATLVALKALSQIPEWCNSEICQTGANVLLKLWEQRKERRPYMFAMGTDFTKLKAPMVWYDILHVLEVLTHFPHLYKDTRLLEMAEIIKAKSDEYGRFTAESMWKAWSDWEFGQKKTPSFLLTLQVHRILKRLAECQ